MIPERLRDQIVLSDDDLFSKLILMTDAFTDELFTFPATAAITFSISRLFVDVERFYDDAEETMSKVGRGMIYTQMPMDISSNANFARIKKISGISIL